MIKKYLLYAIVFYANFLYSKPWADISEYENITLDDESDDSVGLQQAINDLNDGGVLILSGSGSLYLKKTVEIENKNITIVASEEGAPTIYKAFPSSSNAPAIKFFAISRACHWKMINVNVKAHGENYGPAIIARDRRGFSRGSSFELLGGSIDSGARNNFSEYHLDINGMGFVKVTSKMAGNLSGNTSEFGYRTKSLIRLTGKKSGTVEIGGDGRLRQADTIVRVSANYDTIKFGGIRVQCIRGIAFDKGVEGRRLIMRGGNAQTDVPVENVNVSELISVSAIRYAKTNDAVLSRFAFEIENSNTAAIHFFASKLAGGIKLKDSSNLLFFGNSVGAARVSGSIDNILVGGNFRTVSDYDYHDSLTYSDGDDLSKLRITVMEVIK